jgi:O-antigen/teichoic acid export membrane protein
VSTNNSKTITVNSFWYALDSSATTIVMLIASVPVARVMGPKVLGHYIYLLFLTGTAQRLANLGIPATCCKYMAEFLGRQEYGIAHEVFRTTFRYQATISGLFTLVGLGLTAFAEPGYRTVSILVVASMWPAMISYIPAQANVASENLRANIPASIGSLIMYTVLVVSSLIFHWGLIGLAAATLASRVTEAAIRYWGVHIWLRRFQRIPLPAELRHRMFHFSRYNLVLLALGLVVWDRSEILFLKQFCDVRQVAFYSLAFSITNQLLMAPRGFSSAIGITMLAQYGRDPLRLGPLLRNATRYVSVLTIPLFLGTAAVAEPLIRATYGNGYLAVVPVLWILCISSIPRAYQTHTESLLQATERQNFMVKWLMVTAAVNLLLDALLIPKHGAMGAAIANGLAQTLGVAGLFREAGGIQAARPQIRFLGALCLAGAVMVAAVLPVVRALSPWLGLFAGIPVGAVVFVVSLRITRSLEAEDWERLNQLIGRAPKPVQNLVWRLAGQHGGPESVSASAIAAAPSVNR